MPFSSSLYLITAEPSVKMWSKSGEKKCPCSYSDL